MKIECKLTRETIFFSELSVKDYKNFLKETFGDDPKPGPFMDIVYTLLQKVTDKPLEYIKNLSAIDLLCLLIEVRINSVGDVCDIVLKKPAQDKPDKLQLNMDGLKEDLVLIDQYVSRVIQADNIIISFGCPSLQRIATATDEYISFINKVVVRDKQLDIKTNEQAELVFNSLSPKLSLEIIETYKQIADTFANFNLLERYNIFEPTINFIPTANHVVWLIKLLFGESLETFYTTFFHMCYTGHMSAEYLESITVGEYKYFVNCLKNVIAAQSKQGEEGQEEQEG